MNQQPEPAEPGFFDRLRARHGWLDHLVRAYQRFSQRHGSFFAAALSYYTIFALFPLLMVVFSVVGFLLFRQPKWRRTIDQHIMDAFSGGLSHQIIDLMNRAIDSRTSVGVIGLATAAWAGLGWISHLRGALTEMWWERQIDSPGYVRNKISDLLAMLGTFLVMVATIALSALSHARPMAAVLKWFGIPEFSVFDDIFRFVSFAFSMLVSWLLFTWMIARLPREKVPLAASLRAGWMAAVGFEAFKQLGSVYLSAVTGSPAGRTFGPVIGVLVFAYVTGFLLLFSAAWGATASTDPRAKSVDPPPPAIISPRIQIDDGLTTRQAVAAVFVGALGALTFSRLMHWRR